MTLSKNYWNYRFLLRELVKKGIKLKYRRSYLGVIWSLIEPLLTTIILVIVFGTLFRTNNPTYPLYIIIGRLMYTFFSNGTKGALTSIRANAGMIQKVYVPKLLYPLSSVLFNFVITSISCIVLAGVDVYCKVIPTWHLIQFIPAVILILLLTFGVGLILCTLNVFFRDIEYLWNVFLLLIMYMSAIFYYPDMIMNSKYAWILKYNPLYQIIKLSRDAFLGLPFDIYAFLCALIWSLVSIVVGLIFFAKNKNKFILHL
ncbi:MAG: ABC transporter permease [Treponema sp.]|nr:ABC transporter permease [Treponema sp.]